MLFVPFLKGDSWGAEGLAMPDFIGSMPFR